MIRWLRQLIKVLNFLQQFVHSLISGGMYMVFITKPFLFYSACSPF
jgi:hypothetical protein